MMQYAAMASLIRIVRSLPFARTMAFTVEAGR